MIVINLVMIVGNVFVIVVLVRMIVLKVMLVNKYVIVLLVVVDFLVGLFVMLGVIDSVVVGKWCYGWVLGKLNVFGNFLFCILFIMYLVLFFVDCYVVIFCFFVYLLVVIKNKVCGVCLLLWIYCCFCLVWLFMSVLFFILGNVLRWNGCVEKELFFLLF